MQDGFKQLCETDMISIPGTGNVESFVVKATGGAQPNPGLWLSESASLLLHDDDPFGLGE